MWYDSRPLLKEVVLLTTIKLHGVLVEYPNREAVKSSLPGRSDTISAKLGLSYCCVKDWLEKLHAANECHISGWKQLGNSQYIPKYSPGEGLDVPCEFAAVISLTSIAKQTTLIPARDIVVSLLPGSARTIGAKTKLKVRSVRDALKGLHEEKLIHVSDWERNPGNHKVMPIFSNGPGVDAICSLKTLTPAQRRHRQRIAQRRKKREELRAAEKAEIAARASAQKNEWDNSAALRTARAFADHAAKFGDPLHNLFYGKSKPTVTVKMAGWF